MATEFSWMIEAPGQRYLAVRKAVGYSFHWTQDPNDGLRFFSPRQADLTMMALRNLDPKLFGFETTLGNAQPIEHGWMNKTDEADAPSPCDEPDPGVVSENQPLATLQFLARFIEDMKHAGSWDQATLKRVGEVVDMAIGWKK